MLNCTIYKKHDIYSNDFINLFDKNNIINSDINIKVDGVCTINNKSSNCITFINSYSDDLVKQINNLEQSICILKYEYFNFIKSTNNIYILSNNPRYTYGKLISYITDNLIEDIIDIEYINGSYISRSALIGKYTVIEPECYIGRNVIIGENTLVLTGAKIRDNVIVGNNCIIRENCVIGGYGFGIEKDDEGNNFRIPHIGGVILKDNVEVGALSTVASGTIEPTIVDEYCKIDDHVHIAHNCVIGRNTIITACAEVSGSVKIGNKCWIAPNASVRDKLEIQNNSIIGIGAVVTKNIQSNSVVFGNPAKVKK